MMNVYELLSPDDVVCLINELFLKLYLHVIIEMDEKCITWNQTKR